MAGDGVEKEWRNGDGGTGMDGTGMENTGRKPRHTLETARVHGCHCDSMGVCKCAWVRVCEGACVVCVCVCAHVCVGASTWVCLTRA